MDRDVLAEALQHGADGHCCNDTRSDCLTAWETVYRSALLATPQSEAGLDAERLARIEHAARDVDGLWDAKDGKPIRWQVEAGEALEDLRTALRESKP